MLTFTENKIEYIYEFSGFDIETTKGEKGSYMYIWAFHINGMTKTGRTWDEFYQFIQTIKKIYKIGKNQRFFVWVHNLSYEFQFIRKKFNITEIFAKSKREILKCVIDDWLEFRDSMSISGCSLAKTVSLYDLPVEKMVGDLDYSIKRNSQTPLTDKELTYVKHDVEILGAFAHKIADLYIIPQGYCPLTKTGILRHEVKEYSKQAHFSPIIEEMQHSFPLSYEKYNTYTTWLLSGGITHANPRKTGIILEDVTGLDLKSDYPFQMATKYYPTGKPIKIKNDLETILEVGKEKCVISYIRIHNIQLKRTSPISPISFHKCINFENVKKDNGKIWSADFIEIMVTELDLEYIMETYDYDKIEVIYAESYNRIMLPEYILEPVLQGFIEKEKLEKGTSEYMLAKQKPNSGYGMMLTKMATDEYTVNEGDIVIDSEYQFNYRKERRKAFLSPLWGIYVTSHARHTLMRFINQIGNDVVYCDTDSIYLLNYEKHKHIFDNYNSKVIEYNKNHLPKECLKLGTWENEGMCTKFKTLGAKRYIYERNGKIKTTVSGMKKDKFVEYCTNRNRDPFIEFHDNVILSALISGKTTMKYHDEYTSEYITDEYGNTELMESETSCSITEIPFTLRLTKDYVTLVNILRKESGKYENRIS